MTWLVENYDNILAIFGGFVITMTALVKFTKTTKDDTWWAKFIEFADKFSIVQTAKNAFILKMNKEAETETK